MHDLLATPRPDHGALNGWREVVQHLIAQPLDLGKVEPAISGAGQFDGSN
nr:hypothetical protein [Baekduia soli]